MSRPLNRPSPIDRVQRRRMWSRYDDDVSTGSHAAIGDASDDERYLQKRTTLQASR
jgi:hypothetical protein